MKFRKQPGCWLRSSHTFKECVIAHWSSEFARKITGAKLYTEIAGYDVSNNVYHKKTNFLLKTFHVFNQNVQKDKVNKRRCILLDTL